jgi:hypothetical protein
MGKLTNVRIASPCSADWEKMIGDERVRHCGQCNLNVYNISAMTGLEAQDVIAQHEGRLCLRFYHRKDGTILTRNCPVGLKVVMQRVSRVAGIALSAVMTTIPLAAQTPVNTQAQTVQADSVLEVQVVDADGVVCPGVNVELIDTRGIIEAKAITEIDGIARLTNLSPGAHTVKLTSTQFQPYQESIWIGEHVTFRLEISKDPPLIETTNAMISVTGGAQLHSVPLIDNRASAVMNTFSNTVLTTGGAIITENPPIETAPAPHRGFLRRAFSKFLHPWR